MFWNFVNSRNLKFQKKLLFNDNRVFRAVTEKVIVKKGFEFVEFEIKALAIPE